MTRYFLGVDVGGTKSHALVADEAGQALGFGEGGPGNYEGVGWDGLTRTLQAITSEALAEAGLTIKQVAGAGFGVAGYDWPSERAPTLQAIAPLGLDAPLDIVNDAVVGLLAGASDGWGVAVVSGTSNNCRGRTADGRRGRITGQGAVFGEYGGAYEIVMKAVQGVAAHWAMRGPATRLTDIFIELAGVDGASALMEAIALRQYIPHSRQAHLVFEAAAGGDEVARGVITWAGQELASLANGVIRQLKLEDDVFEVVLVGSMYKNGEILIAPLREAIHRVAPQAKLVRLEAPPVVGGVLLGMAQAGVDGSPVRERLIDTTTTLLGKRQVRS